MRFTITIQKENETVGSMITSDSNLAFRTIVSAATDFAESVEGDVEIIVTDRDKMIDHVIVVDMEMNRYLDGENYGNMWDSYVDGWVF